MACRLASLSDRVSFDEGGGGGCSDSEWMNRCFALRIGFERIEQLLGEIIVLLSKRPCSCGVVQGDEKIQQSQPTTELQPAPRGGEL